MKPSSDRPSSPKYLVSTPSRLGHPNIKINKKDVNRALSPDKELYSFFVIDPSYNTESTEERDDKSVKFMFVGRPNIEEGNVQGRHIHAYALCKEAIYSTLENIDILDVPSVLHQFLKEHKHCYGAIPEKRSAYDERVSGFIYQTLDDDSCSASSYRAGVVENIKQSQRIHAEELDERMFSYFDKRYNDILVSKDISCSEEQEVVRKMSDLTPDEREVVSIYKSFIERRNYLSAKDIRSKMKDSEYISICSRMNRMVSEAIQIFNGMPGVSFKDGRSIGSGEKDAMRKLREQNALPKEEQDSEAIALNMLSLIDFPTEHFHDKKDYSLREVLENHIDLVKTAFPEVAVDVKVIKAFVEGFYEKDPIWNSLTKMDELLSDILCSSPKTSPSPHEAAKIDGKKIIHAP